MIYCSLIHQSLKVYPAWLKLPINLITIAYALGINTAIAIDLRSCLTQQMMLGLSGRNLTRETFFELKKSIPQEVERLLETQPQFRVWIEDQVMIDLAAQDEDVRHFLDLENFSKIPQWQKRNIQLKAEYLIGQALGNQKEANPAVNRYLNRLRWRKAVGDRSIAGDPDGPAWTEVDSTFSNPTLPPVDGTGVKWIRTEKGFEFKQYHDAYEKTSGLVNAFDAENQRIGAFGYSITDDGKILAGGKMEVLEEMQGKGIGTELIREVLVAHPNVERITAHMYELNGFLFMQNYLKTKDYFAAIRATPLYQQALKSGFTEIDPPPPGWETSVLIPISLRKVKKQ